MKNIRKIKADYNEKLRNLQRAYWSEGAYVYFYATQEDNEEQNYVEEGRIIKVVDNIGSEPYYIIEDNNGVKHSVNESSIIGEG